MKFTNKITGFFVMGIWFLIVGCAGIGFQMIQPENFWGEAAATIFIPGGCALLYGVNLSADGVSIALLMVFGGLNAAEIFLYYVIVAVRKQYLPVIVYAVAAVLLTLVSGPLVRAREIPGAALSIVFAFLFIVLVYGGVLLAVFGRKGRKL